MHKKKSVFSPFFIISFSLFLLSSALSLFMSGNTSLKAFVNREISSKIRLGILPVSNLFAFSLFEAFAVALPLWIFLVIIYIFSSFSDKRKLKRRTLNFVSIFLLFSSLFTLTVRAGYSEFPGLDADSISKEEIYGCTEKLSALINDSLYSEAPSLDELSAALYYSYESMADENLSVGKTVPKPKIIKCSKIASELRILAFYSFPSSEISINPDSPEYMRFFSLAHEMAHLFGIFGEGDADFYAYRASLNSEITALRYSALLNAFESLSSELYRKDRELYNKAYSSLPEKARSDIESYRRFYFENTAALSELSDKLNGAVLHVSGNGGRESYAKFTLFLIAEFRAEEGK